MNNMFQTYEKSCPAPLPPKNMSGIKKIVSQGEFLTPSGLSTFDNLLGGGVCVSKSVLFVEDLHQSFSRYFVKFFLAQGIVKHHNICYISPIDNIVSISKDLPGVFNTDENPESLIDSSTNLDIAWRYNDMLPATTLNKCAFSNQFDLTKTLDINAFTSQENLSSCDLIINPRLSLQENLDAVIQHIVKLVSTERTCVNRIIIDSIASPLWGHYAGEDLKVCLVQFFIQLRLVLRDSFTVVYITISKFIVQQFGPSVHWKTYADYAFEIEGFDGLNETTCPNPLYEEYSGLLRIVKLPSFSRFNLEPVSRPLTTGWAFKVKRRQFIVQHLNLPPCLSDTVSRSNAPEPILSCGGGGGGVNNRALDF